MSPSNEVSISFNCYVVLGMWGWVCGAGYVGLGMWGWGETVGLVFSLGLELSDDHLDG
jgi:hypothetical protein